MRRSSRGLGIQRIFRLRGLQPDPVHIALQRLARGFQLSAGQQRRIALARLWLDGKDVWILDEPFTAIDQQGVAALDQRLRQAAAQGVLVIYTSHHRVGDGVHRLHLGEDREVAP